MQDAPKATQVTPLACADEYLPSAAPDGTAHTARLLQSPGFRVQASGFRVQGSGFRVQGSGFRVQGSGFRVQGSGVRIWSLGFRVQGLVTDGTAHTARLLFRFRVARLVRRLL